MTLRLNAILPHFTVVKTNLIIDNHQTAFSLGIKLLVHNIPIEPAWLRRFRHNCIRAQEAPQRGRIEARAVVVDSQSDHLALADAQFIDRQSRRAVSHSLP